MCPPDTREPSPRAYLGDGVYARTDLGHVVVLSTQRDVGFRSSEDEIYLGEHEFALLLRFVERTYGCKITVEKTEVKS